MDNEQVGFDFRIHVQNEHIGLGLFFCQEIAARNGQNANK
jgi:hypothetical protein